MKNHRTRFAGLLIAFATLLTGICSASTLDEVQHKGVLKVAVYSQFWPFHADGKGIEVDLAQALADALGVKLSLLPFDAGEDMDDDLRNMVWKGHYLGYGPADLMLHVPVAQELINANSQVKIFAPYYSEKLALAYDRARVPQPEDLSVFEGEPIGVETASMGSMLLLAADQGRLRNNVRHYPTIFAAMEDLRQGKLAAVLALRSEAEAGIAGHPSLSVGDAPFPVSNRTHWSIGLAVTSGNPTLADALSKAMEDFKANGRLARIFASHDVIWHAP